MQPVISDPQPLARRFFFAEPPAAGVDEKKLASETADLEALTSKFEEMSLGFHAKASMPQGGLLADTRSRLEEGAIAVKEAESAIPSFDQPASFEGVLHAVSSLKVQRSFLSALCDDLIELLHRGEYKLSREMRKATLQEGQKICKCNNANNALRTLIVETNKKIVESRKTLPDGASERFKARFLRMQKKCIQYLHRLAEKYPQDAPIMQLFSQKPSSNQPTQVATAEVASIQGALSEYQKTFQTAQVSTWPFFKKDPEEEKLNVLEKNLQKLVKDLDVRVKSLVQSKRAPLFTLPFLRQEGLVYKAMLSAFEKELLETTTSLLNPELIEFSDGLDFLVDLAKEKLALFFDLATDEMAALAATKEKVLSFLKVRQESTHTKSCAQAEIELNHLFYAAQSYLTCPSLDRATPLISDIRSLQLRSLFSQIARHGKMALNDTQPLVSNVFKTIMKRGLLTDLDKERTTALRSLPQSVELFLTNEIISWLHFSDVQLQPKLEVALHNLTHLDEYKDIFSGSLSALSSSNFKQLYLRYLRTRSLEGIPDILCATISEAYHKLSQHLARSEARYNTILEYAYYSFWISTFLLTLGPKEIELKGLLEEVQALINKLKDKFKFPQQLSHETYEDNHDLLLLKTPEDILVPQFFATLTRTLFSTGQQQTTATERLIAFIKTMPAQFNTWKTYPCFVCLRPLVAETFLQEVITNPTKFEKSALLHTLKLYITTPDQFVAVHPIEKLEHLVYFARSTKTLMQLLEETRGKQSCSLWLEAMEHYAQFLKDPSQRKIQSVQAIVESATIDIRYQNPLKAVLKAMREKLCKR